jgi:hypothetical protein
LKGTAATDFAAKFFRQRDGIAVKAAPFVLRRDLVHGMSAETRDTFPMCAGRRKFAADGRRRHVAFVGIKNTRAVRN